MASGILLVCLAAATAFLGAAVLAKLGLEAFGVKARTAAMQRRAGSDDLAHRRIRAGFPAFVPIAERLLSIDSVRRWSDEGCFVLKARGFPCTSESVCTFACGCAAMVFIAASVIGRSWVFGLIASGSAIAACATLVSRDLEARRRQMHEALPDALRAMGICFHAGYTLQQTFDQLRVECTGALGDVFTHASQAIEMGEGAQSALSNLQGRESVPELAFVSVALSVQHQTGGSMRHVLDSTCESLESELELRRSLRVHTAQARLSARVVTGVTVALVAVLSLLSEDFLGPFFQSALGIALLAIALTMQAAGILIVRKMLNVEVD